MERISYTRVTKGTPLSGDLQRDASNVRLFAESVARGELTHAQVASRLAMYAVLAERRAGMAAALEDLAERRIEDAREHLSAARASMAAAQERFKRAGGAR